ncbi:MAG: protein translocase subunit SecF [Planctomycetota bacterium]|nr:protein translocase subunit SecF [Planctomycetota bacterium]
MQAKNLGLKFAIVALLAALSIYSVWAKELRQGIDLKGGHILTFEILATGKETPGLVERVIARLKRRIDPSGTRSLEWRPIGPGRFEVRMPLGTDEARRAKQKYLEALKKLQDGNVRRSEIRRVVSLTGQDRADAVERIAGGNAERVTALQEVARTHDAEVRADKTLEELKRSGRATVQTIQKARAELDDARSEYNKAFHNLLDTNVNTEYLGQVLQLYVPQREVKILPKDELKERREKYDEQLKHLQERYTSRRADIDEVVSAYTDWTERRTGLDDPADLMRMVARAGVLEFRIAPTLPLAEANEETLSLTDQQYDTYMEQLAENGPLVGRSRGDEFQWFPIHGKGERFSTNVVIGEYAGRKYILLYNRDGYTMLRDPVRRTWSLSAGPTRDTRGQPAVAFNLDTRGAKLMGLLTGAHLKHFMAILLDNEVYSAPVINDVIYNNGIITGDFTTNEVGELVRILEAGALAGQVNENPVSIKTVAPSIGKDNRDAGFRAAVWGLIAVAAFMAAYYLLPGLIADFALVLNLVLLLGAMSFIEAVFTLPGIAGVILTIGIAVDANVLIFERLREEQKKTQSMRIAVRNAYSSAASAILDGNITTLLTCVILGWVGSEEIVGFAITLGLGVMFSLFTSLLVTRWIFQLLLELGWIKQRVRMAAFLGTPKINWLGKRKIFWVVSVLLVAAGIGSMAAQGRDVLGIEFSSGTQAVFTFNPGAMVSGPDGKDVLPQRQQIEATLKGRALLLAEETNNAQKSETLKKLAETIKVETLLNSNKVSECLEKFDTDGNGKISLAEWKAGKGAEEFFEALNTDGDNTAVTREELSSSLPERSYQVSTTVADVPLLREVVEGAFGTALNVRTSVKYELAQTGYIPGLNVEINSADRGITHISAETAEGVAPEMRARFVDFIGGAMFIVQNVSPALTETDLAGRIQTMRLQSDFADYQFNRTAVVGLKADPTTEGFSTLAVLALNPNADYVGRPEEWKNFAEGELNLLTASLDRTESLESVSKFDPAIAGRASQLAIIAFILSWMAIVVYLWLRFGSARWGLAAVICLVHDVIIAVGLVALAAFIHDNVVGRFLLIQPFKIDMAVVAAFLTIIGYSVNDTIVVFDRIRENRGKLAGVNEPIINRSINQTISRTLLTTTTTLIAVMVMYIWGGAGIHAFTYALLVGIIVGTYSSIAIASPLLMGVKKAIASRAASVAKAAQASAK